MLLASALACGAVCAEEGTDKLSAAEIEKLDSLRLDYDLARGDLGVKQWVEPMEKLRKDFKTRLGRIQKGFEEIGNLQGALAARTAAKVDPTATTINRKVAQIESVQTIFVEQKKKIELRLQQSLEDLAKSHVAALTAYRVTLTKTSRLDSAQVIDQLIKDFKAKGRAVAGIRPRPVNNQAQALNKGLVAYYPFNGNAKDESGNRNDGKAINTKLSTDRFGKPNNAYSFERGKGYILAKLPNTIKGEKSFTFSMWIRINSHHTNSFLLVMGHPKINDAFHIIINDIGADNRDLSIGYWKWGRTGNGGVKKSPLIRTWTQITIVNTGKIIRTYFDGKRSGSDIGLNADANVSRNGYLTIGGHAEYLNYDGLIDDVRIYDRTLSEAEVKALYDLEKP